MHSTRAAALASLVASASLAFVLPVTGGEPGTTILPTCLRVAPDGSIPFEGQIFGPDGFPDGNVPVRLVFNPACTNLRMCPDPDIPPSFIVSSVTAADGTFTLNPAVGGCCRVGPSEVAAEVRTDPADILHVPFYREVGSPDSGGDGVPEADLVVSLPDFSRFSAAFLTTDACHDYTNVSQTAADYCDGEVKLADFAVFSSHFLSNCP